MKAKRARCLLIQLWGLDIGLHHPVCCSKVTMLIVRSAAGVQFSRLKASHRYKPNCTKRVKTKWIIWDDGLGQEPRRLMVLLLEGVQTDTTVAKRGFPSHVLCSPWDVDVWLSKLKAETNHCRSTLSLRKPSLPSLAAVHWAVTPLPPLRSKKAFYQLSYFFTPGSCHLHCFTKAGSGSLTF